MMTNKQAPVRRVETTLMALANKIHARNAYDCPEDHQVTIKLHDKEGKLYHSEVKTGYLAQGLDPQLAVINGNVWTMK